MREHIAHAHSDCMYLICFKQQERAGVKMVMIQDGPQNTGADKPLRISGEPFKVQVSPLPCDHCNCNIIAVHDEIKHSVS